MSTILVGFDATDRSDDAISLDRDLAVPARSRIVLATAVPYPAVPFADSAVFAYVADLPAVARSRLAAVADPLQAGGPAVETIASGYASGPQRLQNLAEREQADVVVVGSTHSGRWGRVLPGSTGERLLYGAPCAVAVAPIGYRSRDERPLRRVGVAFDGSEESRAPLEAGVMMASRSGGSSR
jgi:nucleotide-binding universal stress UspA family protein